MFGRLICEVRQPELTNTAQTLKFGGIDKADKQPPVVRIGFKTDNVVDRIAVNFL
jgi:hypothetical protein